MKETQGRTPNALAPADLGQPRLQAPPTRMTSMAKSVTVVLGLSVMAAGCYLYATPWISINQFREALVDKDLPGIERHVDFPSLRASLKDQIKANLTDQIQQASGGNPWVNFGMGALGYALAEPMIDAAVETYISPAGLKTLMGGSQPTRGTETGPQRPRLPGMNGSDATVTMAYKTPNIFVVAASEAGSGNTVRFNFERRELVSWKLTSLSLP